MNPKQYILSIKSVDYANLTGLDDGLLHINCFGEKIGMFEIEIFIESMLSECTIQQC